MGVPYAEVIGDPIAQSRSPVIHKFWLKQLGIEADYRATRVSADELPAFLAGRHADPDWRGCNVTMPLKQSIIPHLDVVADDGIGAVNCVVPEAKGLVGRNTDAPGFLVALASAAPFEDAVSPNHIATHFELIGAGGAARAVAAALRGADIHYYNRTLSKAEALADEFGAGAAYGFAHRLDELRGESRRHEEQRSSTIVVNASSMGMVGNPPLPIDLTRYDNDAIVCELIYHPLETPLLREARRLGMRTVDGLAMLIGQARFAFELFFGVSPPAEDDAELRRLLTS